MTDAHNPLDNDGADATPLPHEPATENTSAEQKADKKRKVGSEHTEKKDLDPEQSVHDEPVSESSQESEEDPKPFDFGGLPDRNLKKNLGCG